MNLLQDIMEEKKVLLERSEDGGLGISIQVNISLSDQYHVILHKVLILMHTGRTGLQMSCQGI